MVRPSTPPPRSAPAAAAGSPPTPEVSRRLEESRLRSKALRDQNEAAQRASGTAPATHRSGSGFIPTEDIHVVGARPQQQQQRNSNNKRPHSSITQPQQHSPASVRDATKQPEGGDLRPARKFTKFVDYNFSAMTDTKGGFLSAEDDPYNKAFATDGGKPGQGGGEEKPKHMTQAEWERLQLIRNLRRQKAGPFEPGLSVLADERTRKKCRECGSLEIDFVWEEVFGCCVCGACKEKYPEKYSLLTKTECRTDYLLTEPELRDPDLLPHLSKPNPHKSHWHDMMLFLRYQIEEYAFKEKWGSAEALDAEFERREADKKRRKETKFREKLTELKKRTRTEAFRRNAAASSGAGLADGETRATRFGDRVGAADRHVHEWGRAVENEEGMTVKKCLECGFEVEELTF